MDWWIHCRFAFGIGHDGYTCCLRAAVGTQLCGDHNRRHYLWHYHGQRRADGIILRRPCTGRHNSAYRNGLVYFKLPEKQHG